jgi:hypothetical protein
MKTIEELEKEVWDNIGIASKEKSRDKIAYLNSVALKIETVKNDLQKIETALKDYPGLFSPEKAKGAGTRKLPPDGTQCRIIHKGKEYYGIIDDAKLIIPDFGSFVSLSSAASRITHKFQNGWHFWEFKLSGEKDWVNAEDWRKNRKSFEL